MVGVGMATVTFKTRFKLDTGRIQMGITSTCLVKSHDLMTINRISNGKMVLQFLHCFNSNQIY